MITPTRGRKPCSSGIKERTLLYLFTDDNPDKGTETFINKPFEKQGFKLVYR